MKRIFIGIKIKPDKEFMKLISSIREELSAERIKWTDLENLHLTLAFLGDTPVEMLENIGSILEERCTGKGSFDISLRGLGVFRSFRDPKVLWAGIYQSEKLNALQAAVADGLKDAGIKVDDKPFSPHLTLGRIKHINDTDTLKVMLLKYHSTEIQNVHIDEVILFESILRHEGPEYKSLTVFRL